MIFLKLAVLGMIQMEQSTKNLLDSRKKKYMFPEVLRIHFWMKKLRFLEDTTKF